MAGKELVKDIIQWDIQTWEKALDFWEEKIDFTKINTALEIGGNLGGLSLWLALKGKQVVCSDLENIKEKASPLHQRYKVSDLITYQDIDATAIPYENHFDLIIFKSIIGGIGRNGNIANQQKVFDQIYKALKPGGKLLFAENLIASPLHRFARKTFIKWGNSWRYISLDELKIFLKKFSKVETKTTGVLATFGRSEKQRQLFSTIDQLLLNSISPSSYQYMVYGIAEK